MRLAVHEASPAAIVAVDERARIQYANALVGKVFGYTHDELIGAPIAILVPDEYARRVVVEWDAYLASPVDHRMDSPRDLLGRRKDGSLFPAEVTMTLVELSGGHLVRATFVDNSARKAAEGARDESERLFRAVLESSSNSIVAVDVSGTITYVNPQAETAFGYERNELIGMAVEALVPDRVRDRHVQHRADYLRDAVARPTGIGISVAGRRKDGSEFPVEISLSPVETADGPLVFATIVDVTERSAIEQQLEESHRLESIGRLAGGIAHDFNNMLFAIGGNAELLAEDLSGDRADVDTADARERIAAIVDATDRAAGLTRQLLAFSRQQVVSPKVIDLAEVIWAMAPMLRTLVGEGITLDLDLTGPARRVLIDPSQFDQVLVNLVANARDAMPGGGSLSIRTELVVFDEDDGLVRVEVVAGEYVVLVVSDTGIGIDEGARAHIFEPFFTTKAPGKGTGLGLATTHGIIKQAGGSIWLYSEVGHGTTFKVFLPRIEARGESTPETPAPLAPAAGMILVVEDDQAVRAMTSQMLRRRGYEVVVGKDGPTALEAFDRTAERIDVLVTDVIMPGMSGLVLAQQVRERDPGIGIVLLSGYTAGTLDLERTIAEGAAFLAKPVTSRQLQEAIERVRHRSDS